jgi:hypothetical protein
MSCVNSRLSTGVYEAIQRFDTCTIANAIAQFGVWLRNEGITLAGRANRLLRYAATSRVRSSDPPLRGGSYLDRTDGRDAVAPDVPAVSKLGFPIFAPHEVDAQLPEAAKIQARERNIVQVCMSPDFSTERLLKAIQGDPR